VSEPDITKPGKCETCGYESPELAGMIDHLIDAHGVEAEEIFIQDGGG
jgi:hypothetical protein